MLPVIFSKSIYRLFYFCLYFGGYDKKEYHPPFLNVSNPNFNKARIMWVRGQNPQFMFCGLKLTLKLTESSKKII